MAVPIGLAVAAGADGEADLAMDLGILLLLLAACATVTDAPPSAEVPAVTVAFDRVHGERGASAEGLADPATGRAVTLDDPVRIASVTKPLAALGVMRLVEQGKLDLDADVSDQSGLETPKSGLPRSADHTSASAVPSLEPPGP